MNRVWTCVVIRLLAIAGVAVGGLLPAHALNPECKGAGHWKQFDDILWPGTFAYPASWKFAQDNGRLTLTCPDRDSRIYESYGITISQGERGKLADLGFYPSGTNWVYGQGCSKPTDAACRVAKMSVRNGMTVLEADDQEWRIYNRSGYVGQGEGHETLVLLGDRWMDLSGEGPPSDLIASIVRTMKPRKVDTKRTQ
jgi:hypothetical protein